jgi:hypothetical protein
VKEKRNTAFRRLLAPFLRSATATPGRLRSSNGTKPNEAEVKAGAAPAGFGQVTLEAPSFQLKRLVWSVFIWVELPLAMAAFTWLMISLVASG